MDVGATIAASIVLSTIVASCGSGGSVSTGKTYGAPCAQSSECSSGYCSQGGPGCFHTPTCGCRQDADCPGGEKCETTIDCGTTCR